ncbi:transcriptional regulator with XRE-family HTH domain [Kineococcus radiotolerans]|uniref:Transcriptional regulator with XRE-family HTH domain n=1 Tax=Kineococcus radiotolerans TaxID=131568 RepID=A0A7W4TI98_KINRA|nr:helix-turn-helix domain-containing protein [Kineococcus radiotolerans]MBB2899399.1 transcriptional regulator with XRE-family HTH domain [Kineococcus radiotolerans]
MNSAALGLGRYLRGRREALQPEDVGLPRQARRRVPGLRREEVAHLAGISVEYYVRLERGVDHQPSPQVLAALAGALQLDADGRSYLVRLAQPPRRTSRGPERTTPLDAGLTAAMEAVGHLPVFVTDPNRDVIASNSVANAMPGGFWRVGRNAVLGTFAPRVKAGMPGWEEFAQRLVAGLRATADPGDARLQEIVGTLSVRDEDFRRWWAEHDVVRTSSGRVSYPFDDVGLTEVRWQELEVPGHPGHLLTILHADPATPAHRALAALAARAAAGTASPHVDVVEEAPAPAR